MSNTTMTREAIVYYLLESSDLVNAIIDQNDILSAYVESTDELLVAVQDVKESDLYWEDFNIDYKLLTQTEANLYVRGLYE